MKQPLIFIYFFILDINFGLAYQCEIVNWYDCRVGACSNRISDTVNNGRSKPLPYKL